MWYSLKLSLVRLPLVLYTHITWMLHEHVLKRREDERLSTQKCSRTRRSRSDLPGIDLSEGDSSPSSIIRTSGSSSASVSNLHVVLRAVSFFLDVLERRPLQESSFILVELFLLSSSPGFPFVFFGLCEYSFGFFLFDFWISVSTRFLLVSFWLTLGSRCGLSISEITEMHVFNKSTKVKF